MDNKYRKYDVEKVRKWLSEKFQLKYGSKRLEIKFAVIALNWRGAFSKSSYRALTKEGFQPAFMELMATTVLEESNTQLSLTK